MPTAKLAPEPRIYWLNKRGALYYDPLLDDGGPELRMLECDSGRDVKFVREIVVAKLVPYRDAKTGQGGSAAAAGKDEQRWIARFADRRRKWLEQLTAPGSESDDEARRLSEDAHELAGEVEVAAQEVAAEGYTELTGELDYTHLPDGEISLDDEPPEPEMLEPEEGGGIGPGASVAEGGTESAAEAAEKSPAPPASDVPDTAKKPARPPRAGRAAVAEAAGSKSAPKPDALGKGVASAGMGALRKPAATPKPAPKADAKSKPQPKAQPKPAPRPKAKPAGRSAPPPHAGAAPASRRKAGRGA